MSVSCTLRDCIILKADVNNVWDKVKACVRDVLRSNEKKRGAGAVRGRVMVSFHLTFSFRRFLSVKSPSESIGKGLG